MYFWLPRLIQTLKTTKHWLYIWVRVVELYNEKSPLLEVGGITGTMTFCFWREYSWMSEVLERSIWIHARSGTPCSIHVRRLTFALTRSVFKCLTLLEGLGIFFLSLLASKIICTCSKDKDSIFHLDSETDDNSIGQDYTWVQRCMLVTYLFLQTLSISGQC